MSGSPVHGASSAQPVLSPVVLRPGQARARLGEGVSTPFSTLGSERSIVSSRLPDSVPSPSTRRVDLLSTASDLYDEPRRQETSVLRRSADCARGVGTPACCVDNRVDARGAGAPRDQSRECKRAVRPHGREMRLRNIAALDAPRRAPKPGARSQRATSTHLDARWCSSHVAQRAASASCHSRQSVRC